ncbi:uncharacterized protein Nmag_0244 [Natrialba magadii ATCC 43099]|uniref:Uncharacterized protein n=1 Tax=Natrialba magadii (strain ATCC 43099 / DSM 3394 / CCM 3739 / CIP 104546 / IAM 13178 / JCM 8861 / NBRC 102185 / NCIMB 2190 / MS3) TaxID=547559 RepID=D3SX16_NATMM|nr:uncharacterized protein Nmag_0244 [Natrialba magadii ATCC 43099]ELY33498.1 hypothetical protein C500_01660 [Natrialba magadii ATCC 43099]
MQLDRFQADAEAYTRGVRRTESAAEEAAYLF